MKFEFCVQIFEKGGVTVVGCAETQPESHRFAVRRRQVNELYRHVGGSELGSEWWQKMC